MLNIHILQGSNNTGDPGANWPLDLLSDSQKFQLGPGWLPEFGRILRYKYYDIVAFQRHNTYAIL